MKPWKLSAALILEIASSTAHARLKVFTREEGGYHHCQVDNVSIGTAYMWDWVADVLRPEA
jgi:hypothetical protein